MARRNKSSRAEMDEEIRFLNDMFSLRAVIDTFLKSSSVIQIKCLCDMSYHWSMLSLSGQANEWYRARSLLILLAKAFQTNQHVKSDTSTLLLKREKQRIIYKRWTIELANGRYLLYSVMPLWFFSVNAISRMSHIILYNISNFWGF